jgi:hypothetical protein
MQKLRLWPTDKQILRTFRHSQQLASELAEFLGMIQPFNLSVNINPPIILIVENNEDDSHDTNYENETSEDCEIDLSTAINKASSEIQRINEQLEEEFENNEVFRDGYSQIQLLNESIDTISILNGGDSGKFISKI